MSKLHTTAVNKFLTTRPSNEIYWKNDIGTAYMSTNTYRLPNGDLVLKNPRVVKYGVGGSGFPDLIGITLTKIEPDMVGSVFPIFSTREIKTGKDVLRPKQKKWYKILKVFACNSKVIRYNESTDEFEEE